MKRKIIKVYDDCGIVPSNYFPCVLFFGEGRVYQKGELCSNAFKYAAFWGKHLPHTPFRNDNFFDFFHRVLPILA
jgi:hypothetical protein